MRTTKEQVVLNDLQGFHTLEAIAFLISPGVESRAGLAQLLDTMTEVVIVNLLVVKSESTLEVRMILEVELQVENLRAGAALLDTVVVPVGLQLVIVVVESALKIRILVVVEIGIEDHVLRSANHGRKGNGPVVHGGRHSLTAAMHHVVPDKLSRSVRGKEGIGTLVGLRIESGAGLAQLLDTMTEVVIVDLLVVKSESPLEVRMILEVELQVENLRAGTALLDTVIVPVGLQLVIVVVESALKIRILVVVEIRVKDKFLHVQGGLGRRSNAGTRKERNRAGSKSGSRRLRRVGRTRIINWWRSTSRRRIVTRLNWRRSVSASRNCTRRRRIITTRLTVHYYSF